MNTHETMLDIVFQPTPLLALPLSLVVCANSW